jgi:hypothetical protein
MNAAALETLVRRLTALIDGLGIEAETVRADRGVLTLREWNRYLTALDNAKDALHEARDALLTAAARQRAGLDG